MVYRYRPKPKWLQKVYTTAHPVVSTREKPSLKVYWGHKETVSWQQFLKMAARSINEPALLQLEPKHDMFRAESQTWAQLITETLQWADLIIEDSAVYDNAIDVSQALNWQEFISESVPIDASNTLNWRELTSESTPKDVPTHWADLPRT